MFDNLMESNPNKAGRFSSAFSGSTLSLAIHTGVIYAAVVATMGGPEEAAEIVADTQMVFIQEQPEEEAPPPPEVLDLPPPKGFRTLAAPIAIPTGIPPVDLSQQFDPRDFSGVGVEEGIFEGVEEEGPVDLAQVFTEAVVDEPPERISCPPPEYPRMMQQAGVEGVVVMQGVVDTTGRIERESVEVIQSTQRAFDGPALQLLRRCIFRPGRVRGQAVRVLIQLPVQFSLIGGL
jgi:TonB family protein